MAGSPGEITKGYIKEDVIERIVKGEPPKEDVAALSSSFESNPKERTEFVKELGNNLDPNALHKLNSMVMQQADSLIQNEDPNFQCRIAETKIFQELLQLEAEKTGMKAEFDKEGKFIPPKLSPAIEDHYATLAQKDGFYDKRANLSNDPKEARIAKSVGFMLDAPLARNSDHYKNLPPQTQYSLENELKDIRENSNSVIKPEHKTDKEMGIEQKSLSPQEVQEKVSKIGEAFRPSTNSIINDTIKNLENEKFKLDDEHKNKITSVLSEAFKNVPASKLLENKEEIINNITKDLKEKQTAFSKAAHALPGSSSYHISTENAKKVADDITQKYQKEKQPENTIVKPSAPNIGQDKEQSNDKGKKKNFLQEKVSHMRDTFGKVVIATKNVREFRATVSKSVKTNKDQGIGR
ncbi:MAG: DUF5410 family protein [Rickettsia endosymbiont of Pentastiridius leporinus]